MGSRKENNKLDRCMHCFNIRKGCDGGQPCSRCAGKHECVYPDPNKVQQNLSKRKNKQGMTSTIEKSEIKASNETAKKIDAMTLGSTGQMIDEGTGRPMMTNTPEPSGGRAPMSIQGRQQETPYSVTTRDRLEASPFPVISGGPSNATAPQSSEPMILAPVLSEPQGVPVPQYPKTVTSPIFDTNSLQAIDLTGLPTAIIDQWANVSNAVYHIVKFHRDGIEVDMNGKRRAELSEMLKDLETMQRGRQDMPQYVSALEKLKQIVRQVFHFQEALVACSETLHSFEEMVMGKAPQ